MVLYKIIGSVAIVIAALTLYLEMQHFEKLKIKQINSFIMFIEYIKNQIECFLLPIDVIISACDEDLIKSCGINIDYKKAKKIDDLLEHTDFYCNSDCIELMKQFSNNFGQGYLQEQIRLCDYYRSELIKQRDKFKDKCIKEKKLKLAICLCASLSLILLLV